MKNLLITAFFALFGFQSIAQQIMRQQSTMALDTNMVVYDDQDKPLRYYQYTKLVNSGDYTIRGNGAPGAPGTRPKLVRMTDDMKKQMYDSVKPFITIKEGSLQEGLVLDTKALLDELKGETLNKKAVLLIFWNIDCPPCTGSFANYNELIKSINNPDLVTIAITSDKKNDVAEQLKKTPLNASYILNNAFRISGSYGIYEFPTFVFADKDHLITMAVRGNSPVVMPALVKNIKEALAK